MVCKSGQAPAHSGSTLLHCGGNSSIWCSFSNLQAQTLQALCSCSAHAAWLQCSHAGLSLGLRAPERVLQTAA